MRKSRFNLGPTPDDSPISPPTKKQMTKYKPASPKRVQNTTPREDDPIAKELENGEFDSDNDDSPNEHGTTVGLARAQLIIEYNSALETREKNIRNLAECLEKMMRI